MLKINTIEIAGLGSVLQALRLPLKINKYEI